MERRMIGFHQDEESHCVAELECGHTQHVRHDPPWQNRPWVTREESRREHLGTVLDCLLCNRSPTLVPLEETEAYRDARLQGLCHEGAVEAALAAARHRS